MTSGRPFRHVLGMRVDGVEADEARDLILSWAGSAGARYVCAANVHMTMTAWDDASFRDVVNGADLIVADGVPMVWALRVLGVPQRRRVRVSPDLLYELLQGCERHDLAVALYGGTAESLDAVETHLLERFPSLRIAAKVAPPFGEPTTDENESFTMKLRESGARLILAGIGCPKQERWMAEHADRLDAVLFGVGAAFDLFAGRTSNAPAWTRDIGLEWAWRLALEPRRLWRRYLVQNPRFVALFAVQAVATLLSGRRT